MQSYLFITSEFIFILSRFSVSLKSLDNCFFRWFAYKSLFSRFSVLISYNMWSFNHFSISSCLPCFSGSRFFRVWVQGPGQESMVRVQGPVPGSGVRVKGPVSGSRIRVQGLGSRSRVQVQGPGTGFWSSPKIYWRTHFQIFNWGIWA